MQDLGTLGGNSSIGHAINGKGHVAGESLIADGASHAFLWDGTTMKDLGALGGGNSWAYAINGKGQVAGDSAAPDGFSHAFLWEDMTMKDLGTLGGNQSFTSAMNASGQVTGWSNTLNEEAHAFLWDGTVMRDLGTLAPDRNSFGNAINSKGQVVGVAKARNFTFRAVVSTDGGPIVDLNHLIDPTDPLTPCVLLTNASDINHGGRIAANGVDSCSGENRAYIAVPMQYRIVFNAPLANSAWKAGTTVRIKMALVNADGKRILRCSSGLPDFTNLQRKIFCPRGRNSLPVCMSYDAINNDFYFDWKLPATATTGPTTLKVEATYKFSMPQTITTYKSKDITITS